MKKRINRNLQNQTIPNHLSVRQSIPYQTNRRTMNPIIDRLHTERTNQRGDTGNVHMDIQKVLAMMSQKLTSKPPYLLPVPRNSQSHHAGRLADRHLSLVIACQRPTSSHTDQIYFQNFCNSCVLFFHIHIHIHFQFYVHNCCGSLLYRVLLFIFYAGYDDGTYKRQTYLLRPFHTIGAHWFTRTRLNLKWFK